MSIEVKNKLRKLNVKIIRKIWAEWMEYRTSDVEYNTRKTYCAYLDMAKNRDSLLLVEDIWRWMNKKPIYDKNNKSVWSCPGGCKPHCILVSNRSHD